MVRPVALGEEGERSPFGGKNAVGGKSFAAGAEESMGLMVNRIRWVDVYGIAGLSSCFVVATKVSEGALWML